MFNGKILPIQWCNNFDGHLCPMDQFLREIGKFGEMALDCQIAFQAGVANDEL